MRASVAIISVLLAGCAAAPTADRRSPANGTWDLAYDCKEARFGGYLRGTVRNLVIRDGVLETNTQNVVLAGAFDADGRGGFQGSVLTNRGYWTLRGELAHADGKLQGSGSYEQSTDAFGGPCSLTMSRSGQAAPSAAAARQLPSSSTSASWRAAPYSSVGPVGTRVHADAGGWIEIVEITPQYVRTVNGAGVYATRWGGIYDALPEIEFDRNAPASLWPLEPGKNVSFVAADARRGWAITLTVLRRETVSIGGVMHDTFVVERHAKGRDGNSHESYQTYWYAPGLGTVVKYDIKIMSGSWNGTPPKPWTATRVERRAG